MEVNRKDFFISLFIPKSVRNDQQDNAISAAAAAPPPHEYKLQTFSLQDGSERRSEGGRER